MEKILDDNEKIRRAEEIYCRRNNLSSPFGNKVKEKNKGDFKSKILLQILVMLNLTVIVFAVKNKDFIFTSEFLGEINKYNYSFSVKIKEFLKSNIVEEKHESTTITNGINTENIVNTVQENVVVPQEQVSSSLDEMELDVQNIKAAYSIINPLKSAIVSSTFGARESEYQNINGYHTGIDLACESGTWITCAMEGIVEVAKNEGDYGKHLKIRCNNITTLYAHCSKLYVDEGQIVAQGQKIAKVGSTGNSTGPHLHFEIRVDDRYVDPSKIVQF